jgi:hypothetical protein
MGVFQKCSVKGSIIGRRRTAKGSRLTGSKDVRANVLKRFDFSFLSPPTISYSLVLLTLVLNQFFPSATLNSTLISHQLQPKPKEDFIDRLDVFAPTALRNLYGFLATLPAVLLGG